MALLFCDGFDSYAATSDLPKKWTSVSESPWVWHATNGRTSGGCVQAATTGGGRLRLPVSGLVGSNVSTPICMGFWLKISTTPGSVAPLLRTIASNLGTASSFRVLTSGVLQLYDVNGGAISGVVGGTNVCDNAWHWVEVYQTTHSIFGTINKCYVDGVVQWNGSSIGPGHADIEYMEFVSITSATISLDDVMLWDNSGSDLNGASVPIGAKQISTLRPTSDSATQFTRSTGANSYALVDEVNPDTSDYVESGTSGHEDLYGYGNLGFSPASVTAVVLNSYVANPNPGTINFRQQAKSSSTTRAGTSTIAAANPHVFQEVVALDPNGSIAWTGTAVDAATFGIKVV